MSFFSKIFGTKTADDKGSAAAAAIDGSAAEASAAAGHAAAEPGGGDFVTALSLQLRGDLDPAFTIYQSIAAAHPANNLAAFFSASIRAAKGDTGAAAESLRSSSQQASQSGESLSRVVALALVALVGDEAVRITFPAVADCVVTFGDLLKKEGFVQESAVCFEIAAGLAPDNAHVLQKLGDTLHDLRLYDYAEAVLQEALKHAPNHWATLYTYAVLLQDLGRNDEAISYYERAIPLYPDHLNSQNNFGAALLRANRLEEALAHCTRAAGLDPDSPFVKINLGNIYLLMEEYETARLCFSDAIALNDGLALAYFGLGSVEQSLQSDPKRVQELYLKALELAPMIAEVHHALALLLATEENPEALVHFAAAAQLNGQLKNLHKDFGSACQLLGRREEALGHWRTALEQDPEDAALQEAIASMEAEGA